MDSFTSHNFSDESNVEEIKGHHTTNLEREVIKAKRMLESQKQSIFELED